MPSFYHAHPAVTLITRQQAMVIVTGDDAQEGVVLYVGAPGGSTPSVRLTPEESLSLAASLIAGSQLTDESLLAVMSQTGGPGGAR